MHPYYQFFRSFNFNLKTSTHQVGQRHLAHRGVCVCVRANSPRQIHNSHLRNFAQRPRMEIVQKCRNFAALILQVDISTKVLYFQEFSKIPGQGTQIPEHSDRLLAQNSEAVLAVIFSLAGEGEVQKLKDKFFH